MKGDYSASRNGYFIHPLERILSKFRYGYYMIPILYIVFIYSIFYYLIYVSSPFQLFLWELEFWGIPSVITNICAILLIKYLGKQAIQFISSIKSYIAEKYYVQLRRRLETLFTSRGQVILGILFAMGALLFQIYYLFVKPHPHWIIKYETSYTCAFAAACFAAATAAVSYFLWACLLYLTIGNILMYRWLSGKIENIEPAHPDRYGGLYFLSRYARSILITWFAATLPWMPTYIFAQRSWWTTSMLVSYASVSIGLLLLLSLLFHKTLRDAKGRALEEIARIYDEIFVTLKREEMIDEKKIAYFNVYISILRDIKSSVERMKTFPIEPRVSLSSVITALLPLVIHIIQSALL